MAWSLPCGRMPKIVATTTSRQTALQEAPFFSGEKGQAMRSGGLHWPLRRTLLARRPEVQPCAYGLARLELDVPFGRDGDDSTCARIAAAAAG
jgi:hypothetical protein